MKIILISIALAFLTPQAYAENTKAPTFTLTDASGNEVTLPRQHDGVDIYLFWASWCPYCKALMPHLQSIQIEYGNVRVYALQIRDDEDPVEFMRKNGYDFVLFPRADSIMELYGVKPTPGLFLVDGKGDIQFNLYEVIFDDSSESGSMGHRQKAAQRAPFWAARIRQGIDRILMEASATETAWRQ